jgi:stearoyl-CoA desaturase (delta-9 desaturase)
MLAIDASTDVVLPLIEALTPDSRRVVHDVERMRPVSPETNPRDGIVAWSPVKSLWFTVHAVVAVIGGGLTFRLDAALFSAALTVFTLCLGHSIGLHRLLIHRSFRCYRWLEYGLVHLGTVVGMGGPMRMLYAHDIRDWAQRHDECHPFFIDHRPVWRDLWWQLHFEMRLAHPPQFVIEPEVANDPVYRFLQRTWMLQQLPWAALCYWIGGWPFVIWGISVRITVSLIGHSLVGYIAHNHGRRDWHLEGHAVQGFNVPAISLLTMGESWHNNHHAFPGSARLGHRATQCDPGWWALLMLQRIGLAWSLKQPGDFPERQELRALSQQHL